MWHRSHRSHDQLTCVPRLQFLLLLCPIQLRPGLFPATLVLHLLRGGGGGGGWLARGLTRLPNGVSECIVGKRSLVFRSPTPTGRLDGRQKTDRQRGGRGGGDDAAKIDLRGASPQLSLSSFLSFYHRLINWYPCSPWYFCVKIQRPQ